MAVALHFPQQITLYKNKLVLMDLKIDNPLLDYYRLISDEGNRR
jgi:hypothetical protein